MKTAFFPGSFDPITLAHIDLVQRGLSLFDKVVVGLGVNTNKAGLIPYEDRLELLKVVFATFGPRVEVISFTGLTIDACRHYQATHILRGMRNTIDFEYEKGIAANNKGLSPEIETVFLLADGNLAHLSSTIVRELLLNEASVSHLVPKEVQAYWQLKKSRG
jgi:pantetheine-phosphate adenylyltransferase